MSLIYLKSEQFLNDANNSVISASNSLPYHFTNTFKEPIKVNSKSTIELISADLSVNPEHQISSTLSNDCLTYAFGDELAEQFLQKAVKIPNGNYTDEQLCNVMNTAIDTTNNLDGTTMKSSFKVGEFSFTADGKNDETTFTETNVFTPIAENMGYNDSGATLSSGVGTYGNTIQIVSENGLTNPHTLLNSVNIKNFTSTTLNNNIKQPNLITNIVVPKTSGVHNGDGYICSIMPPLKFRKFDPATFLTNAGTDKFEFKKNGTIQGGTNSLLAYTGSNGYDFRYQFGPSDYLYLKIVSTSGFFNTLTLPNGTTTPNLPWGHFLISNTTDIAIVSNLILNNYVFTLNTNTSTYYWEYFSSTIAGTLSTSFKNDTDPTFIKAQSVETSTPSKNWGSSSLSLSRGETCIFEANSGLTNQVVNGNKYNRLRVENKAGSGNVDNVNDIFADYTIQITQDKLGTSTYCLMNYGTQDASKVAGDTDWMTLTSQTPADDRNINTIFTKRAVSSTDNLVLIASTSQYLCVDFFIGHDTGGNLDFDDVVLMGSTQLDKTTGDDAIHLPMNFNESSFPIMAGIGASNGFLGLAEHQNLITGSFSKKSVNTHSISALNNYMTTNWGIAQEIPTRQKKQTITNYCDIQYQQDLDVIVEPNGFLGKGTNGKILIPDGKIKEAGVFQEYLKVLLRLGTIDNNQDKADLTDFGYNLLPNQFSILFANLGFAQRLLFENGLEDEVVFTGDRQPQHASGRNYVVNLDNLGRIQGQNSATGSISQMVSVISAGELTNNSIYENEKHFKNSYPIRIDINAKGEELINNFSVFISNDDGKPSLSLRHPTNLLFKITN